MARVPPEVLIDGPAGEPSSVVARADRAGTGHRPLARAGVPNARLRAGRLWSVCRLEPAAAPADSEQISRPARHDGARHPPRAAGRAHHRGPDRGRDRVAHGRRVGGRRAPRGLARRRMTGRVRRARPPPDRRGRALDRPGGRRRPRASTWCRGWRRPSAAPPSVLEAARARMRPRFGHRLRRRRGRPASRPATVDGVRAAAATRMRSRAASASSDGWALTPWDPGYPRRAADDRPAAPGAVRHRAMSRRSVDGRAARRRRGHAPADACRPRPRGPGRRGARRARA